MCARRSPCCLTTPAHGSRASSAIRCPPPGTTLPARSPTALSVSPAPGASSATCIRSGCTALARGLQRSAAGDPLLFGARPEPALFSKYKALAASPEYATLSAAQRRIIDNEIRDFRLSGAELPGRAETTLPGVAGRRGCARRQVLREPARCHQRPRRSRHRRGDLANLPADVIEVARASAETGIQGWRFTLHAPSYGPVMQYADNRELRARMYRAYATRASEFGDAAHDNARSSRACCGLRAEEAAMLGYHNFAEVSLVPKMAESPEQVLGFLREMARKARPFAEKTSLRCAVSPATNISSTRSNPGTWPGCRKS